MVWKVTVYYNDHIHVAAPVSIIETGLPSYHEPVVCFERDFIGLENFIRDMLLDKNLIKTSKNESDEAYRHMLKLLGVRSWKKLTEKFKSYSILPRNKGLYVIARSKFFNDKDAKGFGHDESFPDLEVDLDEPGNISRSLSHLFAN
jgi:hypothetical protein